MRLIFSLLFCCNVLFAQDRSVPPGNAESYYRNVITYLASDSMKGRLPGTAQEILSANFIAEELKRTGCKPLKRKRFIAPFDYLNPDSLLVHSAGNVLAKINTRSENCIVITAHYDHIGFGKHHSSGYFVNAVHNGADDNASGVAMLIALSAWCNEHKSELKYDIVFAAVSAEEDGLFGSRYLLNCGWIDTSRIICNINLDMVGHLDLLSPILIAEGSIEFPKWKIYLPADSADGFFVRHKALQFKDGSDHCTFVNAHIPAIMFSTGVSQFYHRPGDDVETINFAGMMKVGIYLEDVIRRLNANKDLAQVFSRHH